MLEIADFLYYYIENLKLASFNLWIYQLTWTWAIQINFDCTYCTYCSPYLTGFVTMDASDFRLELLSIS